MARSSRQQADAIFIHDELSAIPVEFDLVNPVAPLGRVSTSSGSIGGMNFKRMNCLARLRFNIACAKMVSDHFRRIECLIAMANPTLDHQSPASCTVASQPTRRQFPYLPDLRSAGRHARPAPSFGTNGRGTDRCCCWLIRRECRSNGAAFSLPRTPPTASSQKLFHCAEQSHDSEGSLAWHRSCGNAKSIDLHSNVPLTKKHDPPGLNQDGPSC